MKKLWRLLGRLALILLAVALALAVWSRLAYRRSVPATLAEWLLRVNGSRREFSDPDACAALLARRAAEEDEPYALPSGLSMKSEISLEDFQGMQVLRFTPADAGTRTVIYLHGGAYVQQITEYHLRFCDALALRTGAVVLAPLYPLAPNHTCQESYPLLEDFFVRLCETAEGEITLMGDSAGGGLAIGLCQYLGAIGEEQPAHLIAISPWLDVAMSNPEAEALEGRDPMLACYGLRAMGSAWAGALPAQDSRVSPLFGDVSHLPDTTLLVGTREVFYPDVLLFHKRLQSEGKDVRISVGEGLNHAFPLYPIPEAGVALRKICSVIAG